MGILYRIKLYKQKPAQNKTSENKITLITKSTWDSYYDTVLTGTLKCEQAGHR